MSFDPSAYIFSQPANSTATEIIQGALRVLGVVASGESMTAEQAQDGLEALNILCDSLGTERLLLGSRTRWVFPLVVGQDYYTVGTDADFDMPWPNAIERACVLTPDSPAREILVRLLTPDEYAAWPTKAQSGSYPGAIFYDQAYAAGWGSLSVMPITADAGYSLVLYAPTPMTLFQDLVTDYDLQPGVARMLRYRLAVELAPEYDATPDPRIEARAVEATAAVKRSNTREEVMAIDPALTWYGGRFLDRTTGNLVR